MTPRSLINLIQTEQAHMIMQYWDRQMKIVDNPADGCKFRALGKFWNLVSFGTFWCFTVKRHFNVVQF